MQQYLILKIVVILLKNNLKMTLSDKKIENHLRALTNLFNASQYDLLILKCKKIIKEFPEYVILYNILGSAYQNIGELGYAKEIFNKGIKMDPNNFFVY